MILWLKKHVVLLSSIGVVLLYVIELYFNAIAFDVDRSFGFLDFQSHWQSLYDLSQGKIMYRDFYWEYGYLTLLLRLPLYLLMNYTFYSTFLGDFILLPIIAIVVSYLIGKQYLKGKALILFMLLLVLYRTNTDYNGIRHLLPELGLLLAMIGLLYKNTKKTLIGTGLLGLSVISSVEYALIANVCFIIFFFAYIFSRKEKLTILLILKASVLQILWGVSFLLFLIITGAFSDYVIFHSEFIKAFYVGSKCTQIFPRIQDVGILFSSDIPMVYAIIRLLQLINVYIVIIVLLLLFIWNYLRRTPLFLANIVLLLYSLFAYNRTLNTPCYLHYGLTFMFLLLSHMYFEKDTTSQRKKIILVIIVWLSVATTGLPFTLQSGLRVFAGYQAKPSISSEKSVMPDVGMKMSKKLIQEYQKVITYINNNSTSSEYIYVYPDGPYNQLTQKKSPVSSYSTVYSSLVPSIIDKTHNELRARKPSYVIINTFNSTSYISQIKKVRYGVYSQGSTLLIDAPRTKIEEYIEQNYAIVYKTDIAWILKRRKKPTNTIQLYSSYLDKIQWSIVKDKENRTVTYTPNRIITAADHFIIPINIDIGPSKNLSKFKYRATLVFSDNSNIQVTENFVTGNLQEITIYIPENLRKKQIKSIVLTISENKGFLPWGSPKNIETKQPAIYVRNPLLKINDYVTPSGL